MDDLKVRLDQHNFRFLVIIKSNVMLNFICRFTEFKSLSLAACNRNFHLIKVILFRYRNVYLSFSMTVFIIFTTHFKIKNVLQFMFMLSEKFSHKTTVTCICNV